MPDDGSAYQRKLDAVYDAFDRRDDKLALKLSTAALQRQPRWSVMASLRAVALERLGRSREALEAADALLAEAPADDHALNTLALVLKPAGRLGDLGPAFERASAKEPSDESLARGVFLSSVRAGDAAGMQRAALRLDKAFGGALALKRPPEPPQRYKWWAALAAVLQAREAALAEADARAMSSAGGEQQQQQQQQKSALLLQLAEGMVRRLNAASAKAAEVLLGGAGAAAASSSSINNNNNNNPLALTREAAMLHLGLLQALGRYDEALELLRDDAEDADGPAAAPPAAAAATALPAGAYARAIPLEEERLLARAALLQARGDRAAAARLYARHLREHAPDDWASGRHFLDCVLPPPASGAGSSGDGWRGRLVPAQVPHVSSAAVAREVLGLNSGCGHADFASSSPGAAAAAAAAPPSPNNADDADGAAAAVEQLIAELAAIQAEQQAAFEAARAKAKAAAAAASDSAASTLAAAAAPQPGLLPGEDAAAAQRRRRAQMRLARLPPSPRFAPLLRCELALRLWLAGRKGPRDLAEAVAAFHASLGHLDSCFPDARPYLEALADAGEGRGGGQEAAAAAAREAVAWLGGELAARAPADDGGEGEGGTAEAPLEALRRRVSALQLSAHLLGPRAEEGAGPAARLHARVAAPMAAGLRLDPRERGPADELPAMVADALLRGVNGGGGDLFPLLKAIAHLEAASAKRPHVASTRIALCAAHGLAGSCGRALEHFAALDAKHVQHDTLSSHLALPLQLLAFWGAGAGGGGKASSSLPLVPPTPTPTLSALRGVLDLCDNHARDAGDTLHTALKNGTHTKVAEFASFRERLARSQACLAARAEGALLLVVGAASASAASAATSSSAGGKKASSFAALAGARRALKALNCDRPTSDADEEALAAVEAVGASLGLPPARALRAPPPDELSAWAVRARFNADLSVRPGWFGPEGGPLPMSVLCWWEGREEMKEEQRRPPWWLRPGAAEAQGVPEAAALRAALRASTEQRALLQHLLVAALGLEGPRASSAAAGGKQKAAAAAAAAAAKKAGTVTTTTTAAAAASASTPTPALSELLPRLCSAVARSVAPALSAVAEAGDVDAAVAAVVEASSAPHPLASSALLQCADLALFAAVEPLMVLLSGREREGGDDPAARAAAARSRALVSVLSALAGQVAAATEGGNAGGRLLPGSALSLMTLIVNDLGERAVLCLDACAEAATTSLPAPAAGGAAAAAATEASAACAALAGLLAQVEAAAAVGESSSPSATAADALADELMRDPDAADLFASGGGGEGDAAAAARASARAAVLAVGEGQREARASAAARARELVARVRAAQEAFDKRK